MAKALQGGTRAGWNREFEGGLPDCRLRPTRRADTTLVIETVRLGRMTYERVFCANCGCAGGAVTADWAAHIFYLCDECARDLGPPPGCVEAPEALVRGKP